jgi:hypothetical protein
MMASRCPSVHPASRHNRADRGRRVDGLELSPGRRHWKKSRCSITIDVGMTGAVSWHDIRRAAAVKRMVYSCRASPYPFERRYLQTRNMRTEAQAKLKDYDAIMGKVEQELDGLRATGIQCKAFMENEGEPPEVIQVTRQCWNHVFKHPVKRQSKVEKLERALAFPSALKLLQKTTTYQGVSVETDKGGNTYLVFEIVGCIRGNRIKAIIRKQAKNTNAKKVLLSWWQMSSAPGRKTNEDNA